MADKETQIEALLTHDARRLVLAEGHDPKEPGSYAKVFDVTRPEIDAHVTAHGLPAGVKVFTQDSRRDGLYLVPRDGKWQLYTQERGSRYDEETFTDEPGARVGLTSLLLHCCGPDFVHLLGFEEAVLRFGDWQRPWLFYPQVEARLLNAAGKSSFRSLWFEATAARHWKDADPVQAGRAVEQALRKRYPTLSQAAVAAVVQAAAHRWR